MRAVNLLPRDDHQRTQSQQNLPALLSTALIVLVMGLLGVMYFSSKSTAEAKALELQDAQAELGLLPSPEELAAKGAPQRQLASEHSARVAALSAALTHRVAWDRVLRQISLVLPEDVWLKTMNAQSPNPAGLAAAPVTPADQPPKLLTVEGYTYSHDAVARLMTRLSVIPDLSNVWLERSSRGELAGRPVVTFKILADVRGVGTATS
jgi:Tfp pilus assembly protein PilN